MYYNVNDIIELFKWLLPIGQTAHLPKAMDRIVIVFTYLIFFLYNSMYTVITDPLSALIY